MLQKYFLLAVCSFASMSMQAQYDEEIIEEPVEEKTVSNLYWGFKGGLTMATQKWKTFQSRAMPTYHGDFFVEYLGKWSERKQATSSRNPVAEMIAYRKPSRKIFAAGGVQSRFGVVISLGYHQRGGTYRTWNFLGVNKRPRDVFHNISLLVGGKGQFRMSQNWLAYYGLGLRAEVTPVFSMISTYAETYANRFNYGIWFAGGVEFMLSKTALFLEISISPDVSKQVLVPQGAYAGKDFNGNDMFYTQTEKVYNLCFEVSLGVKFGKTGVVRKGQ